jgi:heme-degrading monooxygenase HmoA
MKQSNETKILKGTSLATEINFYHVAEENQQQVAIELKNSIAKLSNYKGFVSVNILTSTDESRICTYIQWDNEQNFNAAMSDLGNVTSTATFSMLENNGKGRLYEVHYADDRSEQGFSIISPDYKGTMFINEITTIPGPKQFRLLEMVVHNNEKSSFKTPGYRSANFHRSLDGERAVNYSLWDSEEHLIQAITDMADQDENLEETVQIASPDFRFYTLFYFNHI